MLFVVLSFVYYNTFTCFWQKIQNFGEPFFLVIHADETLANVKIRIQKKLNVSEEEFFKVVFRRTNSIKIMCSPAQKKIKTKNMWSK